MQSVQLAQGRDEREDGSAGDALLAGVHCRSGSARSGGRSGAGSGDPDAHEGLQTLQGRGVRLFGFCRIL